MIRGRLFLLNSFFRFGTLRLFHLHRQVGVKTEHTVCSETWAYKSQTPGNYLEESIQHSEHGESLKSKLFLQKYKSFFWGEQNAIIC